MVRILGRMLLACATVAVSAPPALAQHTLNVSFGRSLIRAEGRVETDILSIEHNALTFDVSDFDSPAIGAEWLVPIGDFLEAGAGISFTQKTVSTVHVRARNSDGSDIPRDLGLRQVPMALTVRWLPLRQSYGVQPYVGGGMALVRWRFSESGDFVIPSGAVFRNEQYDGTGAATGPVVLLGLRMAREALAFGFEGRYIRARGSFGEAFARVQNPDLDLGGWTVQATVGLRILRP